MDELEPRLRLLLDAVRTEHDPDDQAQRRVRAAVAAALSRGAGAGGKDATADKHAPAKLDAAMSSTSHIAAAGKWLGVLVLAGGLATIGALQLRQPAPAAQMPAELAPPLRAPAPAGAAPMPPPTAAPELLSTAPSMPPEQVRAVPPEASTAQPEASATQPAIRTRAQRVAHRPADPGEAKPAAALPVGPSELSLITSATRALRENDPQQALGWLDQHASRYSDGMLREERQGLRVLSLCALGLLAQGRAERDHFLQEAAHSPLAGRVRAACVEPGAP